MKYMRPILGGILFAATYCVLTTLDFIVCRHQMKSTITLPKSYERSKSPWIPTESSVGQSNLELDKCMNAEVDWTSTVKPKYELDRNKFLIPTLLGGPNNQMMGFHQSVLLSLILNRTLVIPVFYEHSIDNKFYLKAVPAEHRINIAKLRGLLSVITLREAVRLCRSRIDTIFADKYFNVGRKEIALLMRVYMQTGLSGVKLIDGVGDEEIRAISEYIYGEKGYTRNDSLRNRRWWPKSKWGKSWIYNIVDKDNQPNLPVHPQSAPSSKVSDARSNYASNAKCALHWFPFRQYGFPQSKITTSKASERVDLRHFTADDGWKLFSEVLLNTCAPEAVGVWSKKFQHTYLTAAGGNYLAFHWRYDTDDFMGYICKNGVRQEFCESVRQASNSSAIATAILSRISELDRRFKAKIESVYVAAPAALANFTLEIVGLFSNEDFARRTLPDDLPIPAIVTSTQLKGFVLREYRNCPLTIPKQLSDTISQLEMDICVDSYSFMWSRQSTWSGNVKQYRFLNNKAKTKTDTPNTDYVIRMMQSDQMRKEES